MPVKRTNQLKADVRMLRAMRAAEPVPTGLRPVHHHRGPLPDDDYQATVAPVHIQYTQEQAFDVLNGPRAGSD
jgi:hypothetical protein